MNTNSEDKQTNAPDTFALETRKAAVYLPMRFVRTMLPLREPASHEGWIRTNGHAAIRIQSGLKPLDDHGGSQELIGLPYGSYPRILLCWVTTEVLRNRSPDIRLGRDAMSFARSLGLNGLSGGATGQHLRLLDQMRRLFCATFTLGSRSDPTSSGSSTPLWAPGLDFYEQPIGSRLSLSDDFYTEVVERSVKLDARCVYALSQAPLAFDVYCWLRAKVEGAFSRQMFTWEELMEQFGSQAMAPKKFRELWRNALARALDMCPDVEVNFSRGGVTVRC